MNKFIKKKITYFYLASFISIFLIFFLVDFFYKKYIVNLSLNNQYRVSASQVSDFKQNSLNQVLEAVFKTKEFEGNSYRIEKLHIENERPTIDSIHSKLEFNLILENYADAKELEKILNKIYSDLINEIIYDFKKNNLQFNYYDLKKEYLASREAEIEKKYNRLIDSKFFKNYPPKKCFEGALICLEVYSNYYNFILNNLNNIFFNSTLNVENWINLISNEKKSINEIFQDFNLNRYLFSNNKFFLYDERRRLENEYFSIKYYKFLKTKFYSNYIGNLTNFCLVYKETCFKEISNKLSSYLYLNELEINNKFKIIEIKNVNKKFNIFIDIPIILAIAITLTYFLFSLTNKSLLKKIK